MDDATRAARVAIAESVELLLASSKKRARS
jgi:hypothetical protein